MRSHLLVRGLGVDGPALEAAGLDQGVVGAQPVVEAEATGPRTSSSSVSSNRWIQNQTTRHVK
jgi:hypothetical protein